MLGGEPHVGRAVKRVGPRAENANLVTAVGFVTRVSHPGYRKLDFRAFAATNPISLEQLDARGPAQPPQFMEQALGIRSDAQHPLAHRPPNNRMTAYFAAAVNHFL